MFEVVVTAYQISPVVDIVNQVPIYKSCHRSVNGAARRLASIIHGKSAVAKDVAKLIPRDHAGRYVIDCGPGVGRVSLKRFREITA